MSRRRRIAGGVLEGSVCLHFPRQLLLASLSTKETSIKSPTGWLLTPVMLPSKKKYVQCSLSSDVQEIPFYSYNSFKTQELFKCSLQSLSNMLQPSLYNLHIYFHKYNAMHTL